MSKKRLHPPAAPHVFQGRPTSLDAQEYGTPSWITDEGYFDAHAMMHTLVSRNKVIYLPDEKIVRQDRGGVYQLDNVDSVEKLIIEEAERYSYDISLKQINEVVQLMKWNYAVSPDAVVHPRIINCKNGIIDLSCDKLELKPHPDDFLSITQIPVKYNPAAKMPVFRNWLMAATRHNASLFNYLIESIGVSLIQDAYFDNIFILVGPTNSGKSTFLHVLKALVGKKNISTVSLHELDDSNLRFTRARLFRKLVNISTHVSPRTLEGEKLKVISAGDRIQGEKRGEKPFGFKPYATLWGAANEMPASLDKSAAFYDRLQLIPFKYQHSEGGVPDPFFVDKLTTEPEKEGILALAISYAHQILKTKGFQFAPKVIEQEKELYREDNQSALDSFIEQYLTAGTGDDSIHAEDLYEAYQEFCQEEGEEKEVKSVFGKTLRTVFPPMKRTLKEINGVRTRYYTGIKYIG